MKRAISGLYAVTPDLADTADLLARVAAALDGGASVLQYRNKAASPALRFEQAQALLALCRGRHVPLIVNDDIELAIRLDADGLHLGAEDGALPTARARLSAGRLLGASCYNRLENAMTAVRDGADYVAFGSFFPSTIKLGAVHAPLSLLQAAKRKLAQPVVAIGGITLENAPQLVEAGADAVAVISALFSAPDVRAAAQGFNSLFARS